MSILTKFIVFGGLFFLLFTTYAASKSSLGLSTAHDKDLIKDLNENCPENMRDQWGNCRDRTYRSTYYGVYVFGTGRYGGGAGGK
jgi:hypothetical protein